MKRMHAKKSETLKIRMSLETKAAFMARCRGQGRTASEVVREIIAAKVNAPKDAQRRRSPPWRLALAAAGAGLAVGAAAAPSIAHPAWNARAAFDRLDRNHDGVLSFEEFHRN